jgi:hypothetical protein
VGHKNRVRHGGEEEQEVLGTTNRLDSTENDASNNSSIFARVFVATGTCLLSRCLATIGEDTDSKVIS